MTYPPDRPGMTYSEYRSWVLDDEDEDFDRERTTRHAPGLWGSEFPSSSFGPKAGPNFDEGDKAA